MQKRVGRPQFQSTVKTRPKTTDNSANTANTTRTAFYAFQREHRFLRSANRAFRVHQTLTYMEREELPAPVAMP
eukprot:4078857-Lingulodinium_polyedra.AAC.1